MPDRPGDDAGDETRAIPVGPDPARAGAEPATGWILAGRYRVLNRVGSGGMAEVFRAHDEQLDRDVAVKVFRTPVDEPGNAMATERRETELRVLAQLSHPNLITLYDANITGSGPAFLVSELVIGPNLATRLEDGPLPEGVVRTIGAQIADALAYVHTRGMVHRDVKPANILLGTDAPTPDTGAIRARLSDFGIVRIIDGARMTAAEFTLGTVSYLAPEQAIGGDVDAAADVYSLGLVLIEMLTGVRSFDGPMHEALAARLTRSPDIPAGLPAPWPGLLAAMTRSDRSTRPTAAEVAQSLRTGSAPAVIAADSSTVAMASLPPLAGAPPILAPLPVAPDARPGPLPPGSEEPHRRHGVAMAVAALIFIAIIATVVILILRSSNSPGGGAGTTTISPTTGATTTPGRSRTSSSASHSSTGSTSGRSTAQSSSGATSDKNSPSTPRTSASRTRQSSSASASRTKTRTTSPPATSSSAPSTSQSSSAGNSSSSSAGAEAAPTPSPTATP